MKSYIVQHTHLILIACDNFINPILHAKKNQGLEREIIV